MQATGLTPQAAQYCLTIEAQHQEAQTVACLVMFAVLIEVTPCLCFSSGHCFCTQA